MVAIAVELLEVQRRRPASPPLLESRLQLNAGVIRTPGSPLLQRTPTQQPSGDTRPNATVYDLKQLAFAVLLFELVIAGLTVATRAFFGIRTAVWVGLGIGGVVLVAFVLITLLGIFTYAIAGFFARREARARRDRSDAA